MSKAFVKQSCSLALVYRPLDAQVTEVVEVRHSGSDVVKNYRGHIDLTQLRCLANLRRCVLQAGRDFYPWAPAIALHFLLDGVK